MSLDEKAETVERWATISREEIADCRIFTVDKVTRRSPSTGELAGFFRIRSKNWVNVIAITPGDEVVLIRQYRQGSDEITLEIPGGIIDGDESPADAARRELLEETGYACRDIVEIGRVRPNPAIMDNWAHILLATGLEPRGSTAFDEHEQIDLELLPLAKLDETLRSGAITHSLVLNAFLFYRLRGNS
jgi:8-oxo-dGTP pyrophosphatase MutT (NUDIX family)